MAYPCWEKATSDRDEVLGKFLESDVLAIHLHARAERAAGHDPRPVMIEVVQADGSLRYEVVDGPRCDHLCSKCRADIDHGMAEFGDGAIGAFADSSGGEMERLRRELRQLAGKMTEAVHAINARLPSSTPPQIGRSRQATLPPPGAVQIPHRDMHHSQGVQIVEVIAGTGTEDDDAER
jgi:hypothetical protein